MRASYRGLRFRLLATLGVLFLGVLAVQFGIVKFCLLDQFVALETGYAERSIAQYRQSLQRARSELARVAALVAGHPALKAGSDEVERLAAPLGAFHVDALVRLDTAGNPLEEGKAPAGSANSGSALPLAELADRRPDIYRVSRERAALVTLHDTPVLVAAHEAGFGYVLLGRRLDPSGLEAFVREDQRGLTLSRIAQGSATSGVRVSRPTERMLVATAPIADGLGGPGYRLRAEIVPEVVVRGRQSLNQLQAFGVIFAIAFFGTLLILLNRWVLRRVEQLDRAVAEIASGGQGSIAEGEQHDDELARLSRRLDSTFAELQSAQQALQESEEHFRSLAESIDGAIVVHREDILYCNPATAELTGYSEAQLDGRSVMDLVHPDDRDRQRARMQARLRGDLSAARHQQVRLVTRSGEVRWVDIAAVLIRYGGQSAVLTAAFDVTEYKRIEERLAREKERMRVTLDSVSDGVVTTDTEGRVDYVNPVADELSGWSRGEAEGRYLQDILTIIDERTRQLMPDPVVRCLREGRSIRMDRAAALVSRHGDREYCVEVKAAPMHDASGQVTGAMVAMHDVTELRALAERMSYQASHDPLTDLVNRRELEARLEQCIGDARQQNERHALCYLDLDQFKVINDTCGHRAGDALLQEVADELRRNLRETDTVARLGGDEFGIILHDCDLETARRLADRFRGMLREFRFTWQGMPFDVGCSVGLVVITEDSPEAADLLALADAACHLAKEEGRNRIHVYAPDDIALTRQQGEMRWMHRIQRALEEERFQLYLQPIVALGDRDGPAPTSEVLMRMVDEDGSLVMPGEFLAAAERYGLMPSIDRWVADKTVRALKRENRGNGGERSVYSINVSGQTLGDEYFLHYMVDLIERSGIDASQLCFEITETAVVSNLEVARRFIGVLRNLGCCVALDDFGSGLSSFAYLKSLPVDLIKIDGQFVRTMLDSEVDHALVEIIVELGRIAGMATIAEFVENEALRDALHELGVDYGQGDFLGPPRPMHAPQKASANSAP